ncbi:MAG TPA: hypothetical protein VK196_05270 [Magnetospirillum sp.]|nr:hypothetical protein [Magnetospirillum sp.]
MTKAVDQITVAAAKAEAVAKFDYLALEDLALEVLSVANILTSLSCGDARASLNDNGLSWLGRNLHTTGERIDALIESYMDALKATKA